MVKKEEKTSTLKDCDLEIMMLDVLDLRTNTQGYELLTDYVVKKLKEDGAKIRFIPSGDCVWFNGKKIDYSLDAKENGVKEMVMDIIESGEEKGLGLKTPLGVWLNFSVELMSKVILSRLSSRVERILDNRSANTHLITCMSMDKEVQDRDIISGDIVRELFDRSTRNIRKAKLDVFLEVNGYVL